MIVTIWGSSELAGMDTGGGGPEMTEEQELHPTAKSAPHGAARTVLALPHLPPANTFGSSILPSPRETEDLQVNTAASSW